MPTLTRNVSAVALRLPQRSEMWLFDCGEGTQHQFLRSDLRVSQLRRIFITHMHGDHIFGLPGLMASLGMAGSVSELDLYGPSPLENYLNGVNISSSSRISYLRQVHDIEKNSIAKQIIFEDDDFIVRTSKLDHRVPAFAYRVDEKPKPGRFNLQKAKELDIPPGPIYSELQKGKKVKLKDGRIFDGKDFSGPQRKGASFVYCTDTVFTEAAIALAKDADLLIHEATFSHKDSDMAYQRKHSTSTMAAQTASEAGVGQLILTHLSPRYSPGNRISPKDLLSEAQAIFPNTLLAKDFLKIDVQIPATVRDA